MARTRIYGFDASDRGLDGINGTGALPSGVSYDTTTAEGVGKSIKIQPASGSAVSLVTMQATANGEWRRARFRFTVLPSTTARIFVGSASSGNNLRINPNGTVAYFDGGTLIGTSATALTDTAKWYTIEWHSSTNAASQVRLRIDEVDEITTTNASTFGSGNLGCNDTVADTYTMFVDDYVVDNAAFPGPGAVRLLLPISDNARAALWVAGSNATTATTDLWEGVNNTPPVGTATSNAVTAAISHEGGADAATDDYDANMTSYTSAGIPAGSTINAIQAVIVHGEDIATGAKELTFSIKSNPAQGAFQTNFNAGIGAVGTYPTNWNITRGTMLSAPTVVLGTSPVMAVRRPETASRRADVCFMGMYVDYTAGGPQEHSGAVSFAAVGTAAFSGLRTVFGAVAFAGAATAAFQGRLVTEGAVSYSGAASYSAEGTVSTSGAVSFSGAGSYSAVSVHSLTSTAAFSGVGSAAFAATVSLAKLETLQDNFDDNAFDTGKWVADTSFGGTVTEQNHRLEIAGPSTGEEASVSSVSRYDLTGSSAYVRLTNLQGGDFARVEVVDEINDTYYIEVDESGDISFHGPGGIVGSAIAYVAATHAWLRIRESSGTMFADTAPLSAADPPDAGDWTNRWSESTNNFDPTSVIARFRFGAGDDARVGYFDGFNTTTGAAMHAGAVSYTGAGTFSAAGTVQKIGAVAFQGAGTADFQGRLMAAGAVTYAGAATFAAEGTVSTSGAVQYSGTGTYSAVGSHQLTSQVAATGTGAFSAAGTVTKIGLVQFAGAGSFAAEGTVATSGAVQFSGAATFSASAAVSKVGAADFAGAGSFAATGTHTLTSSAAFAGAASFVAAATVTKVGAVAFTGSSTAAFAGTVVADLAGEVSYSATGTFDSAATVTKSGAWSATGTAAFSATATHELTASQSFVGSATFSAAGLTGSGGAVSYQGAATASFAATVSKVGAVQFAATAAFVGAATTTRQGAVQYAGSGSFTAAGTIAQPGAAEFSGSATFAVAATVAKAGAVQFAGTGSTTFAALATRAGAVSFSGAALVAFAGQVSGQLDGQVSFTGTGTFNIYGMLPEGWSIPSVSGGYRWTVPAISGGYRWTVPAISGGPRWGITVSSVGEPVEA